MKPNHFGHFVETIVSMVRHSAASKKAGKGAWAAMRKLAEDHASQRDRESASRQFDMEIEQALQEAYSRLRALGISNPSQGNGMSTIRRNRACLREALRLGIDLNGTRAAIERTVKELTDAQSGDQPEATKHSPAVTVTAGGLQETAAAFVAAMLESGHNGDDIVAAVTRAVAEATRTEMREAA